MSVSPPIVEAPFNINQPMTAVVAYTNAAGENFVSSPTSTLEGITLTSSDTTGQSILTLSTDFLTITAELLQSGLTVTGTLNYTSPGGTPVPLLSFTISDAAAIVVNPTPVPFIPVSASLGAFTPVVAS